MKHSALMWTGFACLILCQACTYRGYSGEVNDADLLIVEARNGAVLGRHSTSGWTTSHSYYSRGEFVAGPSEFHAATAVPANSLNEDDDEEEYVNRRTVRFNGRAGARYWLIPSPAAGHSLAALITSNGYEGYRLVDQQSGAVVAVIR